MPEQTAQEIYQHAYALHYKKGEIAAARQLYEQLISSHPQSDEAGYAKSQLENIAAMGHEEIERLQRKRSAEPEDPPSSPALELAGPVHAIVTDVQMPFWSMVVFMMKWAIAAVPALIMLTLIAGVIMGFLGVLA